MNRRSFLRTLAAPVAAGLVRPAPSEAALPKAKITRVRIYLPPNRQDSICGRFMTMPLARKSFISN